jgi:hypothetical protein
LIYEYFSKKTADKVQVLLKSYKNNSGTSHEDRYTFLIISLSVLRGMRNVSDENCRENQNTHFFPNNFLFGRLAIYEIMWENIVQPVRLQYGALHAGYLRLQTYTLTIYNTY